MTKTREPCCPRPLVVKMSYQQQPVWEGQECWLRSKTRACQTGTLVTQSLSHFPLNYISMLVYTASPLFTVSTSCVDTMRPKNQPCNAKDSAWSCLGPWSSVRVARNRTHCSSEVLAYYKRDLFLILFFLKELKHLFIILFIFPVWLPYFLLLEVNSGRGSYCLVICQDSTMIILKQTVTH